MLFWVGLVALVGWCRAPGAWAVVVAPALLAPLVLVVGGTLAAQVLYAVTDFQGYPDLYPLLVYAAIGFGGAVALVVRRCDALRGGRLVATGACWRCSPASSRSPPCPSPATRPSRQGFGPSRSTPARSTACCPRHAA